MNLSDIVDRAAAEKRGSLDNLNSFLPLSNNPSSSKEEQRSSNETKVFNTSAPAYTFAFSPPQQTQPPITAWTERAKTIRNEPERVFLIPHNAPQSSEHTLLKQNKTISPTLINSHLLQQIEKNKVMPSSNQSPFQQTSYRIPKNNALEQSRSTLNQSNLQQQTSNTASSITTNGDATPSLSSNIQTPSKPTISNQAISRENIPASNSKVGNALKRIREQAYSFSKLTVTGRNVSAENIADGYVQFLVSHDPRYLESLSSMLSAKRKILTVPKTNTYGIAYTIWDLFCSISRLQKKEIKNWSQLVSMLGLDNAHGRPQFAQRIKRWMHKHKIDCYFNYLLGNDYDFHNPQSSRNKSILSVNPTPKRKGKEKEGIVEEDELEGADMDYLKDNDVDYEEEEGQRARPLMLPPGGKKRLRHNSDPEKMMQAARNFIKRRRDNDSDGEEENGENEREKVLLNGRNERKRKNDERQMNGQKNEIGALSKVENSNGYVHSQYQQENEDDEDELESSASSSASPAIRQMEIPISNVIKRSSTCNNCDMLGAEIMSLKKEVANLKSYMSAVEDSLTRQKKVVETSQLYINQLLLEKLKLRGHYTKWKQKLAKDILDGPTIPEEE
ncbi:hypothetical protein G6F16_001661 [Rhizopus arrhizus]|nr:hypothetical protein G6F21_001822 [Rhizopus arrhizus]KAG0802671.1 hypothetical protein G6F22_000026 [Rhizopus arrhizus]KAG0818360.1 hypothetical protein G6F20_001629 [Rhizopus arrhizus]KAG0839261.1 hypothetical protein G6F19_002672 [Rhizopus arrhizus]KAG0842831.1 hypothetical protein G6F18_002578 [Rhizopus arrhizus]